jgi:hypothetical protein
MMKVRINIFIPAFEDYMLLSGCVEQINKYLRESKIFVLDDSLTRDIENMVSKYSTEVDYNMSYLPRSRIEGTSHVQNWNRMQDMLGKGGSCEWYQLRHHDDYLLARENANNLISNMIDDAELVITPVVKHIVTFYGLDVYRYHCHPLLIKYLLGKDRKLLYFFNYIGPTACLWLKSKQANYDIRFNESLIWLVDCDWYARLLNIVPQQKIRVIREPYVFSVLNEKSITSSLTMKERIYLIMDELKLVAPKVMLRQIIALTLAATFLKAVNIIVVYATLLIVPCREKDRDTVVGKNKELLSTIRSLRINTR